MRLVQLLSDEWVLKICVLSYPNTIAQDLILELTSDMGQYNGFSTIGVAVTPYRCETAKQPVKFLLWHISASEVSDPARSMYLDGGVGCIVIIDKTNRASFTRVETICHEIRSRSGAVAISDDFFLSIIGLTGDQEVVRTDELQKLAQASFAEYFEVTQNPVAEFRAELERMVEVYGLKVKHFLFRCN